MSVTTKTANLHVWHVRRWRIEVISGRSRGLSRMVTDGLLRIGTDPRSDIVLQDPLVSREHLEARVEPGSVQLRDLGSKNGTYLAGARVSSVSLPSAGAILRLGDTELGFSPVDDTLPLAPSAATRCGRLVGKSDAMRLLFASIERIAKTNATVLINGETGCGKELVAQALHELGPRAAKPFVVVDCGAIPHELIESELFGHARGAFTGAVSEFSGAFARAHGGTLFLDEIGELPLDLQPKLLRALETQEVRPIGRERTQRFDVRIIAASLRDLRRAVADKIFREDLYYRLAVVPLALPPLRDRLEDLPLLVEELCSVLGLPAADPESIAALARVAWPGNVRQLRNVLERSAALSTSPHLRIRDEHLIDVAAGHYERPMLELPYKEAKELMIAKFTRDYLDALLRRHGGNVSAAGREAGIDRTWILQLARKHGVRVRE